MSDSGVNESDRQTPWADLGLTERMERMRGIIKAQKGQIDYLQETVWQLRSLLFSHEHHDGKTLIPADEVSRAITRLTGVDNDQGYF